MHSSWSVLRYRVAQLRAALCAEISPVDQSLVAQVLTAAEQRLFAAMPRYDQRHCLDVYYTLSAAGYDDPLLLRAALFHDCGKVDDDGRPMPLVWYLLVTLLKCVPSLYRMAAISGRGPLRAVQIYAEHAWRGAQMAQAAGSPSEIVTTIRHYHDVAPQGRAAILQWADEQN
ncbi:MAG: HDIG domain-containing protein [Chloroflexales bacterium]|nr:HDIG domain-containing protein [Chloroflexales bacterium]